MYTIMHVCKTSNMQVYLYASMQVCKRTTTKYTGILVSKYAAMQLCKYATIKYATESL